MFTGQIIIPFLLTFFAGLSTVLGGLIYVSHNLCKRKFIGFFLGLSAGVMIYLSFIELLPYAIKEIGFINANAFFFIGIVVMALLDFLIPHHYLQERACRRYNIIDRGMFSSGFMITLALILHNIPEGVAVFLSSFTDIKLGIILALAITVHNIPEGIAVAAPIYHATGSKRKAIKYTAIAGLAEPFGAVIAYLLLGSYLNQGILSYVFSLVAGVMIYISFDELIPHSMRHEQGHQAVSGLIAGMIIVAASLHFLG